MQSPNSKIKCIHTSPLYYFGISAVLMVFHLPCISGMDYIKEHLEDPSLAGDVTSTNPSDDGDFFADLASSNVNRDSNIQLDGYLALSAERMQMATLKSYPAVCKLSVKLNTPLPASAACECLFSVAGQVFSPRRARLDAQNFENQLLLKVNSRQISSNFAYVRA